MFKFHIPTKIEILDVCEEASKNKSELYVLRIWYDNDKLKQKVFALEAGLEQMSCRHLKNCCTEMFKTLPDKLIQK